MDHTRSVGVMNWDISIENILLEVKKVEHVGGLQNKKIDDHAGILEILLPLSKDYDPLTL
jgi:hypothetical protein